FVAPSLGAPPTHCRTGEAMLSYDELVKLARFCANQAQTGTEKDVRARAWRLAVEYRKDAAKLGKPPDIGEIPSDLEKVGGDGGGNRENYEYNVNAEDSGRSDWESPHGCKSHFRPRQPGSNCYRNVGGCGFSNLRHARAGSTAER